MKEFIAHDGTAVGCEKLFELEIEMYTIKITESLGGSIPTIEFTFGTSDEVELFPINTELEGYLTYPSGLKDNFKGYIYSVNRNLNHVTLKILCCDPTFTKDPVITKYSNIDSAIESLWQRDRLDQVTTDLIEYQDPYYIYQRNETNYKLCTKLCKAYKYNSSFGYLINGLKIIDLNNPVENELILLDRGDIRLTQSPTWSNSKLYELTEVGYIDYNSNSAEYETDPTHITVEHYTTQITVDSVYKELIGNYLYNTRLETARQLSMFTSNHLIDYHVGDYCTVKSDQLTFMNTFISKRIIEFNKTDIKVDYEIQSINPYE